MRPQLNKFGAAPISFSVKQSAPIDFLVIDAAARKASQEFQASVDFGMALGYGVVALSSAEISPPASSRAAPK
jgi:hypothetical protein